MSADWTPEQRRCLAALGYTVYRPVAPAMATTVDDVADAALAPLLRALLRAAGRDPASVIDVGNWSNSLGLPPLASLRTDPGAKRALWPRLRAMRSERLGR